VTSNDAQRDTAAAGLWAAATVLLFSISILGVCGCGGRGSPDQRIKDQLAETKGTKAPVARFSGRVTIDGLPPAVPPRYALVLILYSAKDAEPGHETIYDTVCDNEGHFQFTRYSKGDGVPPGSYTVLFEELMPRRGSQFSGADQLKNRYNDPDTSPFHVEIAPPGKGDWEFNLEIAGKDPVASPGPHAVTRIVRR
jgi:hypothetical protein